MISPTALSHSFMSINNILSGIGQTLERDFRFLTIELTLTPSPFFTLLTKSMTSRASSIEKYLGCDYIR